MFVEISVLFESRFMCIVTSIRISIANPGSQFEPSTLPAPFHAITVGIAVGTMKHVEGAEFTKVKGAKVMAYSQCCAETAPSYVVLLRI